MCVCAWGGGGGSNISDYYRRIWGRASSPLEMFLVFSCSETASGWCNLRQNS